jgi:uncharacterized RDD family membrane protein YckC
MKSITPIHTRYIAHLIDYNLSVFITLVALNFLVSATSIEMLLNNLLIVVVIIFTIPVILRIVQVYLTTIYGGSIGKLICGIKVVDMNEKNISLPMSFFRTFIGTLISSVLLGLGYIWILLDKKHQGWHDMASGTIVVNSKTNGFTNGLVTFILSAILNSILIFVTISNLNLNINMYENIFLDVAKQIEKEEPVKKIQPTPTVYPRIY